MKIPFLDYKILNAPFELAFETAFRSFLDSGWYVLGQKVKDFEQEYATFNNVNHCIGLANGLDALILSLKVLGIGPGDEVIVPSNTYIASWLAVSYVGATPVPVEPVLATYNINPALIEAKISSKTKAIMPVHLYGQSCEMAEIMRIAAKFNLYVVEDNAQAQGAVFNEQLTGTWGECNATSFYPGKNLGALGDAGAVTTNNKEIADQIAILRNYGSEKKYYNQVKGVNSRLDELQAAFLSIKLKTLVGDNTRRQFLADRYSQLLEGVGDIVVPVVANNATSVFHLYVIRTEQRDELQQFLQQNEIGTMIHYPIPPHLQQAYADLGYTKGDFPLAEKIANTCLSLPLWPTMNEDMQDIVVEKIKAFFR